MRLAPIHDPFSSPYFSTAVYVYCEQLGEYRQLGGIHEKRRW
jgi:hypothetical protein